MEDLFLALFADADFAGDKEGTKSTSGGFLVLLGPHSFFPLTPHSEKQGSTANSTTEPEIVSLAYALRHHGIPTLDLFEELMGRKVKLFVSEDNEATAKVVRSGKYKKKVSITYIARMECSQIPSLSA